MKVDKVLAPHDIMVEPLHVDMVGGGKGSQYVNCLCLYTALVICTDCISISHQKVRTIIGSSIYGSLAIHISRSSKLFEQNLTNTHISAQPLT